jgi:hypothetical protein
MTSIHNKDEVKEILAQIENHAENSYVNQLIGKPNIPVFFVHVLHLMLKDCRVEREKARLYAVATTLLKMAIDIHEKVSLHSKSNLMEQRKQQLTVLAGDYYSSLFYRLLAEQGEVAVIRCLAEATCLINEWKMSYHMERGQAGFEVSRQALERIKLISSELIMALADFFHVQKKQNPWRSIAAELLLLDEVARMSVLPFSEEAARYLEEGCHKLEQAITRITDPKIKRDLADLAKEAHHNAFSNLSVKEGGRK